jgi:uncharacterized membrane protein YdjX (TVP38/TMEM64 family)
MLALLLALAAAVFVVRSRELHAAVSAVFAATQELILNQSARGMAIFVLLSALSAMVAFFSSAVLVPIGLLAWGSTKTFALLWLGWLLGGMGAYATGRFLGRRAVAWLIREDQLRRCERRLAALALAELPFAAGAVYLGESFIRRDRGALVAVGLLLFAASAAAVTAWHQVNGPRGGRR